MKESFMIITGAGGLHFAKRLLQCGVYLRPHRLSHITHAQAFQLPSHVENNLDFLWGNIANKCSPSRCGHDQPVTFQSQQRFADGPSANSESACKIVLDDSLPWAQVTPVYSLLNVGLDLLAGGN